MVKVKAFPHRFTNLNVLAYFFKSYVLMSATLLYILQIVNEIKEKISHKKINSTLLSKRQTIALSGRLILGTQRFPYIITIPKIVRLYKKRGCV